MDIDGWAADDGQLAAFLAEANLGRLGTLDEDGNPHVVPVWFAWQDGRFLVGADASDHKVANIRERGRASLVVDSDLRRKRGILVRGTVRLVDGDTGRAWYQQVSELQLSRYQPDRPAAETAARMASRGAPVVIEITPTRIVSWGR